MDRKKLGQLLTAWAVPAGVLLLLLLTGYRCPIRERLGIPCPGCGVTHGLLALLRLDFAGAWQANPTVYPLVLAALWMSLAHLRGTMAPKKITFCALAVAFFAIAIWCLRVLLPLMLPALSIF